MDADKNRILSLINRIKHFENNGYRCLVIWKHELKDLEELKEKVETFYRWSDNDKLN